MYVNLYIYTSHEPSIFQVVGRVLLTVPLSVVSEVNRDLKMDVYSELHSSCTYKFSTAKQLTHIALTIVLTI